ncbi:hypothetical protein [Paenibacillus agricola]|uniref:Uncharacterized protein n=1 Tax=Paenibacillus agricola TaxID=2716264 RepID=A0ABX0JKT4_9BACL|nr:hypothetical protein [Paenibacillus agricola]NHN34706.1 hypothetical protein [Paenibacillus agricola]
MWFLNKETGLTWDVSEPGLIKRLEKNEHYEQVTEPIKVQIEQPVLENKNTKRSGKEVTQ